MILGSLRLRNVDEWGSGAFGAKRGNRTHRGIDYLAEVDQLIASPAEGFVTKLGYCYTDDPSYRYVQITTVSGDRHRIFYIAPCVRIGNPIAVGQIIGVCQDLQARYPANEEKKYPIPNHVHYEIINQNGEYIAP